MSDRPEKWSTSERDEALAIAAEHGAEEASRQTGIAAGTIRYWTHRLRHAFEGDAAAALIDLDEGEADVGDAFDDGGPADLVAASERWHRRAQRAADRMDQCVQAGKAADARNLATVAGIAQDKALMLARAAQAEADRQVAITEKQAEQITAVIRGVVAELRLPDDLRPLVPRLVRRHLDLIAGRPAGGDGVLAELSALRHASYGADHDASVADAVHDRAQRIRELRDEIAARREASDAASDAVTELQAHTAQQGADAVGVDDEPPIGEIGRETTTEAASVEDGEPAGLTGVVPARPRRLSPATFNVRPMRPGEQWIPPHGGRPGGDAA